MPSAWEYLVEVGKATRKPQGRSRNGQSKSIVVPCVCRVSPILLYEQYSCALTINTLVLGDEYQILLAINKLTATQAVNAGHTAG
jgi:hypothetical protein